MTNQALPPSSLGGAGEDAESATRRLLAEGLAAARAEWGAFDLPPALFADRALARVARRLERAGVARTPEAVREALERTARADLALAVACSEHVAGAWEVLVARLTPRLEGLARRRGASAEEAATTAADVIAQTSLPAAQRDPRTLLETYDGSGSLFGWAAVVLVRRLARERGRGAAGGPAAAASLSPEHAPRDPRSADPSDATVSAETARRLSAALAAGWGALPARERLALACRYVDGRPQTEIATVLRVSEPHTSRILAAALARFREVVLRHLGPEAPELRSGWPTFVDAVRRSRVFADVETPLPSETPPPSKGRP